MPRHDDPSSKWLRVSLVALAVVGTVFLLAVIDFLTPGVIFVRVSNRGGMGLGAVSVSCVTRAVEVGDIQPRQGKLICIRGQAESLLWVHYRWDDGERDSLCVREIVEDGTKGVVWVDLAPGGASRWRAWFTPLSDWGM